MNRKAYFIGSYEMKRQLLQNLIVTNLLFLLLYLSGCAHLLGFTTYYDPVTYKNLTDIKPEVMALYETFSGDSVDTIKVSAISLKLAQIYEYENGKGAKNIETTKQIKIIQEMFERHVADRIKNGKWNETHLNNQKQNMAEAFDIAIQTERLKNKNE